MFLKDKNSNDLVEILTIKDLFDPFCSSLIGRYQRGEDPQDPETFDKSILIFPSGEELPRCWMDPHYRNN